MDLFAESLKYFRHEMTCECKKCVVDSPYDICCTKQGNFLLAFTADAVELVVVTPRQQSFWIPCHT